MDNLPNAQSQIPQQPEVEFKQPGFFQTPQGKVIAISGGVLLLLTVVVILNYLSPYPSPFLFLPKKQTSNQSQQSTAFSYDARKAEDLLTKYIKDSLKPEFLPSKIEVKQNLIASGKQEGTDYEFGANWTVGTSFFQSNFHYDKNTNNPRDMEFSIQPKDVKESTASANLTQTLTTTYLKNLPSTKFDCGVFKDNISFCENFSATTEAKTGFGLAVSPGAKNTVILVFSCSIPKKSSLFNQRTSCLLFREK